jgi:uncharacterized integral membrane protein
MKGLRMVILLTLVLLGVFVLANWSVLTARTTLSLLAFSIEGPLGLILLGIILVFLVLFMAHAITLRTTMLLEARRHAADLKSERDRADQADASRISELRREIDQRFSELRAAIQSTGEKQAASAKSLNESIERSIELATNSLSASIGDLDRRLERAKSGVAE